MTFDHPYPTTEAGCIEVLEAHGCTIEREPDPSAIFANEQVTELRAPNGTAVTVQPSQGLTLVRIEGDARRYFLHTNHELTRVLETLKLTSTNGVSR